MKKEPPLSRLQRDVLKLLSQHKEELRQKKLHNRILRKLQQFREWIDKLKHK